MDWRRRRQFFYILIISALFLIFVAFPIYLKFNKPPSCFDGERNGDEIGVDCGGSCLRACVSDILEPTVLWVRSFKITEGVYNATAYIQNTNSGVYATNVPYIFRIFDKDNLLISEREGRTDIFPGSVFPVFEGTIFTGERVPQTTFFDFENIDWLQGSPSFEKDIIVKERVLSLGENPRLRAVIENSSIDELKNIEVVVVLYDENDNAINSSKTVIDKLSKGEQKEVVFTWSQPFSSDSLRIEIFSKVNL